MPRPDTPQALHDYFHGIDAAPPEEADQCRMHYSCACMVHNGRRAAEMLLAIQAVLGVENAAPATTETPAAPAPAPADSANFEAANARAADLAAQVEKLSADNDRLRSHIQLLQRQINRLYDRRELSSVLEKLEAGKGVGPQPSPSAPSDAPPPNSISSPTVREGRPETDASSISSPTVREGRPETDPSSMPHSPPRTGSPLADMLSVEGAMPVRDDPKPE